MFKLVRNSSPHPPHKEPKELWKSFKDLTEDVMFQILQEVKRLPKDYHQGPWRTLRALSAVTQQSRYVVQSLLLRNQRWGIEEDVLFPIKSKKIWKTKTMTSFSYYSNNNR
ncbi:hypothetical protein M422DRAFT_269328 [Sphaerobolus stellatus SS14]|uniref:Uncharacterized protein n=1 Tax=Sphaerobolus stellatus (strain SS14) TaxID=990650 RepID=A0A0C9U4Q0_SPHS4|nr:hypothetical protein M422DRAFT_269328 [Sphaerobolus stellatus SS14]